MKPLNNKIILSILNTAKDDLLREKRRNHETVGLCNYISIALEEYFGYTILISSISIKNYIPMFTPEFLDAGPYISYDNFWWSIYDFISREKALNKLIKYYEEVK